MSYMANSALYKDEIDSLIAKVASLPERLSPWLGPVEQVFTKNEYSLDRYKAWLRVVGCDEPSGRNLLERRGIDFDEILLAFGDQKIADPDLEPDWVSLFRELQLKCRHSNSDFDFQATLSEISGPGTALPPGVDGSMNWPWLPFMLPLLEVAKSGQSDLSAWPGIERDFDLACLRLLNRLCVQLLTGEVGFEEALISPPKHEGQRRVDVYLYPEGAKGWLDVWRAFPVLCRLFAITIMGWRHARSNFLTAWSEDLEDLQNIFGSDLGEPKNIQLGEGDHHNGGLSVCLVTFENFCLAYKPRPPGPEPLWNALLDVVNPLLAHPISKVESLVKSDREWQKFVQRTAITTTDEISRYFWRFGAITRLLQGLHAIDFHGENLIPDGEFPVLIDFETLLSPGLNYSLLKSEAKIEALRSIKPQPNTSGIISTRANGLDGFSSLEIGGLAPTTHQQDPQCPFESLITPTTALPNCPEPDKELAKNIGTMRDGYLAAENALASLPENWLQNRIEPNTLLRHVVRDTRRYVSLLDLVKQPSSLTDGIAPELIYERLWCGESDLPTAAHEYELQALRRLDVPTFYTHASSQELRTGDGETNIYFGSSALDNTKLQPFGSARNAQLELFEAAMFIRIPAPTVLRIAKTATPLSANYLEDRLRILAKKIVDSAVTDRNTVVWTGLSWNAFNDTWSLEIADPGWFSGRLGIASVLERCSYSLNDITLQNFARKTRRSSVQDLIVDLKNKVDPGFDFACSLLLAMKDSAFPALYEQAEKWFNLLPRERAQSYAIPLALFDLGTLSERAHNFINENCQPREPYCISDDPQQAPWSHQLATSSVMVNVLSEADPREIRPTTLGDCTLLMAKDIEHPVATRMLTEAAKETETLAQARSALEAQLVLGYDSSDLCHCLSLILDNFESQRSWFPDLKAPDKLLLGRGFGLARLADLINQTLSRVNSSTPLAQPMRPYL